MREIIEIDITLLDSVGDAFMDARLDAEELYREDYEHHVRSCYEEGIVPDTFEEYISDVLQAKEEQYHLIGEYYRGLGV